MGTARRRLVAALWCMVVAVAGCGGGGGDDGAGGAASGSGQLVPPADYFPVAAGNRWFWRSATTGQSVASVRAQQSVAGQSAWQTEAVDEDGPATRYIAVGPDSIRAVPNPLDPVESLIGAYDLLRFPMRVGGRFSQLDRSFALDVDGDGRNDSVTIRSEVTVVGLETLSTPLGTLSNVLHTSSRTVTTVSLAAGQGRGEGIVVQDDWYAPDVGPVRTDTSTAILGGPPEIDSRVLIAYHVNGRRSESLAPAISSLHPAHQSRRAPSSALRVTFDEDMDTFALRSSGLHVVRADGSPVPGRLEWTTRTLSFQPTNQLAPGQYTMRAETPWIDAAGNTVAGPLQWNFTIANDAWPTAAMSPPPDAVDVALTAPITITFDDEPDPATVTNITLSDGASFIDANVQAIGRVVTLTPRTPLQRTRQHVVYVGAAVLDRHGNTLVDPFSYTFFADGGAFGAARRLYDSDTSTPRNAIADMNGDGRADLVTLATLLGTQGPLLYVLYQQPDGTLAPPVEIARTLAPRNGSACAVIDFVLRDMNGDGRTDIALAANSCGIEVLLQAADGSLPSSHFVDMSAVRRVHTPDLDGDGVADLVGSGFEGMQLWRGRGNAAPTPLGAVTFSAGIFDSAMADLDGNGRADIVTLLAGNPMRAAWRLQAADGSFGAEQSQVAHDSPFGGALAVGDVTGDGRADIIASRESNSPTFLALLRQRPDGSFGAVEALPTYDSPGAVLLADLNADGVLDIVVGHSVWLQVGVYFSGTSGSAGSELLYPVEYQDFEPGSIASGDLNGDGMPDLIVGKNYLQHKAPAVASLVGTAPRVRTAARSAAASRPGATLRAINCAMAPLRAAAGCGRAGPAASPTSGM